MNAIMHIKKPLDAATGRSLYNGSPRDADGGALSRAQPEPDPRWYVLQTNQQAETWAEGNLKRAGYETFLPLVTELRRDRVLKTLSRKVEAPCFPGYLFIKFCAITDPWRYPIAKAEGVKRIFCTGSERPIPVPHGQVERMIADADARRVLSAELPPIGKGTALIVTAGPFTDRDGVCIWSSETRTRLLMEVLGAQVTVEVARGAVRAK